MAGDQLRRRRGHPRNHDHRASVREAVAQARDVRALAVRTDADRIRVTAGRASLPGNIVWLVLGGWWLAFLHLITGALLCLTVLGIPLGVASFKMAGAALAPFGKQIVRKKDLRYMPAGAVTVPEGD